MGEGQYLSLYSSMVSFPVVVLGVSFASFELVSLLWTENHLLTMQLLCKLVEKRYRIN